MSLLPSLGAAVAWEFTIASKRNLFIYLGFYAYNMKGFVSVSQMYDSGILAHNKCAAQVV